MKNPVQIARALWSAARLLKNPDRLNDVFTLADSLGDPAMLASIVAAIAEDADPARALIERPRIGKVDLAALRKLPEKTLGREFAEHMIANKLDPAALPSFPAHDEVTYLRAHLYETHDIWHAVTGFDTDVAGEVGLQAFYMAQFPSRLGTGIVAGGLLNALLFAFDERDTRMRAIVRGWLMGKRARPFFGVRWASMWDKPLDEVRKSLDVDIAALELELPNVAPRAAA